jgi:serine phosphatase RsbU (regulator of sigma subunit)
MDPPPAALPHVADVLDALSAEGVAGWVAETASALAGCPVALYVVDLEGTHVSRVVGDAGLPDKIPIGQAVGPELPRRHAAEELERLRSGGVWATPLWLRGRAVGLLLSTREPAADLAPLAREASVAIDVADRYTDVFETARRRRPMSAAAELQEGLLPPRIATVPGAELAATVVPAYEVGGDWFDYAEQDEQTWLAVGDASGKGNRAAALSALCVGALRAARRDRGTLEEAVTRMDEAVRSVGDAELFVTVLVGRWEPAGRTLAWIGCGHPRPLVVTAAGDVSEAPGVTSPALGVASGEMFRERNVTVLQPGDRLLLYSDGVTERRVSGGGRFGLGGLERAIHQARSPSAASLITSLLAHVLGASDEPPDDDATALALLVR